MTQLDYLIFVAYLAASVLMGGAFAKGQTTLKDYLLAGGGMKSWVVGLTVLAALFSGISYLAGPAEVYEHGLGFAYVLLAFFIATPITTLVLLPRFMQERYFTAYQLLEERFSLGVRLVASGLFIGRVTLWLAAATFAPALALEQATGLPLWITILATGLLTTVYTTMGGMRAVIWTDLMQLAVLFGGQMIIAYMAVRQLPDGMMTVWDSAMAKGSLELSTSWSLEERVTLLGLLVGGTFMNLVQMATDQVSVQRYLTAENLAEARRGLWIKLWFIIPVLVVFYGTGLVLAAFYESHPDPLKAGLITRADQILPYFVVTQLPHGLPGLLIAAIFAASMSTVSSGLNSLTSATMVDFESRLWPARYEARSEVQQVRHARLLTALFGIMVTGLAFLISGMKGNLVTSVNTVIGLVGGPMLGLFGLAVLTRWVSATPALVGAVVGFAITWMVQGYTKVSFLWFAFIGFAVTMSVAFATEAVLRLAKPKR